MPTFQENVKGWYSRLFDHQPVQYATVYMPSGNSSSRDSLDAASDDVGKGLIEKDRYSRLPLSAQHEPWWKRTTVLVISHMVLLTVYAAVLFVVVNSRTKSARMEGMPVCELNSFPPHGNADVSEAPAISALKWEKHKFSLEDRIQEKGSYSGKPNAELDKAWHDLLNCEPRCSDKSELLSTLIIPQTRTSSLSQKLWRTTTD